MGSQALSNIPHIMVFGGRDFSDYDFLRETLDDVTKNFKDGMVIVTGEWRGVGFGTANYIGADLLAEKWAIERRLPYMRFPPHFDDFPGGVLKKHAGAFHKRNREMVAFIASLPKGFSVGFHDGKSPGTASVIELLAKAKVKTKVFKYKE
jgi:hypothetical protein